MQFDPNDRAANLTELVMRALSRVDVLKPDEPNYPTHYNRAFSAVYAAFQAGLNKQEEKKPTPRESRNPNTLAGIILGR